MTICPVSPSADTDTTDDVGTLVEQSRKLGSIHCKHGRVKKTFRIQLIHKFQSFSPRFRCKRRSENFQEFELMAPLKGPEGLAYSATFEYDPTFYYNITKDRLPQAPDRCLPGLRYKKRRNS